MTTTKRPPPNFDIWFVALPTYLLPRLPFSKPTQGLQLWSVFFCDTEATAEHTKQKPMRNHLPWDDISTIKVIA